MVKVPRSDYPDIDPMVPRSSGAGGDTAGAEGTKKQDDEGSDDSDSAASDSWGNWGKQPLFPEAEAGAEAGAAASAAASSSGGTAIMNEKEAAAIEILREILESRELACNTLQIRAKWLGRGRAYCSIFFFLISGSFQIRPGVGRGLEMILTHSAPSCFNMSHYRAMDPCQIKFHDLD